MMGSTAFSSRVTPRLVQKITVRNAPSSSVVEVWTTTCIVTNFNIDESTRKQKRVLVNPSNPGLTGCSRFTYFPRGGPVPKDAVNSSVHRDWQPLGYVSSWGGMEVGTGMMYPVSVVDGLVHQTAGWKLQAELSLRRIGNPEPCPIGTSVRTFAGDLAHFDAIIHTTPPFYRHDEAPAEKLTQCYKSGLDSDCK